MEISYNSKTLLKDGKPWMPTMGEIQYSRTERRYWKEDLYKAKAAGVEIVSSYVMWIHHEEIENHYDFRGNKNLRYFLQLIKECGMYAFLRIGPWIHGEVRNGGFPDWLLEKGFQTRSNDERYFKEVKKYLTKLFEQVDGYLLKQGGPVIGVQIENEFGAALRSFGWEAEEEHFKTLEDMIKDIGFKVPLYTATGWGNSHTGSCLPVWGGYCDAPWNSGYEPNSPNDNYIFSKNQNDASIASDSGDHSGFSTTEGKFPYLTAELGGGIHATQNRRPIAGAKDLGAMSVVKLGSGANLLGYYTLCGGKNPIGALSTMQEYKSYEMTQRFWTGYASDLPCIDYDFQAPISSWQETKPSYKELKKVAMFTNDFGELLSPMDTYFPNGNPTDPSDTEAFRYTFRTDGESGFLFINNYQRHIDMPDRQIRSLTVPCGNQEVLFKDITVKNGEYFIYPFNLKIGGAVLKTAKAQPLCILNGRDYVFFSDRDPEYEIEGDLGDCNIITLSSEDAANAYKISLDKDYLIISKANVINTDNGVYLIGEDVSEYKSYPQLKKKFREIGKDGVFTCYSTECKKQDITADFRENKTGYTVFVDYPQGAVGEDVILTLDYIGDTGRLYLADELIMDQYCNGNGMKINLASYDYPHILNFEITPLDEENPVYIETEVEYNNGRAACLKGVSAKVQYRQAL